MGGHRLVRSDSGSRGWRRRLPGGRAAVVGVADSNIDVAVAGVGSVPSNATSVQLSVTALAGTSTSSAYVYPTGATKPTSANVRWETGETVTIPVTVAVGTGGKIHFSTDAGTVTVKVAVVGYFSPASAPGSAGFASQPNEFLELSTSTTTSPSSSARPPDPSRAGDRRLLRRRRRPAASPVQ
jgi:hypothetical protein